MEAVDANMTRDSKLELSPTDVKSAGPVSEGATLSNVIGEFTQEKNPTTVKSVAPALDGAML